ncbi:MAG: cupin domain-containing protein [Solirubrobacteraceae bacterium]
MPPAHPITSPPRRIHDPHLRETVTFVETAAESGGRRSLVELDLAPGARDPLHRHDAYDERFEVLDGALTVEVDGVARLLEAGETLLVAAGSEHRVVNRSGRPVAVRLELCPGHAGYERALQVAFGLAAEGRRRRLSHAAVLAAWEGRRLPGRRAADAALGVAARWARGRGLGRRLAARYCRW